MQQLHLFRIRFLKVRIDCIRQAYPLCRLNIVMVSTPWRVVVKPLFMISKAVDFLCASLFL
ncbi:hypothetical protein GT23_2037 [Parageobacillus thermoglucosidasius]|nr:hypothetical protein GT23_2037 [Parageobacillus thermoglucosidasius]